jgi:thioredoxin 1
VQLARRSMPDAAGDDGRLIQLYLGKVVEGASVTDSEVEIFYSANREAVGGAPLARIAPQIRQYLLREKQQEIINRHVRTFGERTLVVVSAGWAEQQAKLAGANPVDEARASGRPTFANFGAKGCIPCDKMEPIREALRKKYEGRLNVVFVHVGEQPILASRYGVQGIPLLVFYGADGEEVFRHSGFFPQESVEEQLTQLGL